ncbi:MAG TPA: DUF2235 domain-containing protein [Bryobacteraceae bacterium]|nr:DUF2235 domain-containing protein [Bryobacteraceae bacterium]
MPKNIVICSDGTGNTAIKGRGTNVFKLYEAVDLNGHRSDPTLTPQIAIYDDGVGNENFRPLKVFAGITGFGLARNLRLLYKSLVRVYDPGDSIFLFGFSRGAFTVRALAGLISKCGILDVSQFTTNHELNHAVRQAYRVHREDYRTKLSQWLGFQPDRSVIERFRARYARHEDVRIRFIGVWDTVDAVGVPFHIGDYINLTIHRFKFPDQKLVACADYACQALSLDDERRVFQPLLWDQSAPADAARIEQVWFAGCHSNVGGGYEKQGMSLVSLEWMMRQAERRGGLRLLASDLRLYREHANVDDKLYDPRAGTGILYRWSPRDMGAICRKYSTPPLLHLTVLERIAHGTGDYCPGNIAPDAHVVVTDTDDPRQNAELRKRARLTEAVLRGAHKEGQPLLRHVRPQILIGRSSYYVYLASSTITLLAACVPPGAGRRWNPAVIGRSVVSVLSSLLNFDPHPFLSSARRLIFTPDLLGLMLGGLLDSWVMAQYSGWRMDAIFSVFWHDQQPKLRDALREAGNSEFAAPGAGDGRLV